MTFRVLHFCFYLFLCFPLIATAAVPTWEIVPNESKIQFVGTQNNAPVAGEFKKFTGEIVGDLNQIPASHIKIIVDTNSLHTSFKDLEDTLRTEDWFGVKLFPDAIFAAKDFKKINDNTYVADGTLTIRNKTLPLKVQFTLDSYTKDQAKISGSTTIDRTKYEVGKGEWASTDDVGADVTVNFTIVAKKKI